MAEQTLSLSAEVPAELSGERADRIAAACFPDYSRSMLRRWIDDSWLLVDGRSVKPRQPLYLGQRLGLEVPASAFENWHAPQPVPFKILYEDDDLLVVDKPAGIVVHPGAGNRDQTLVNGLIAHRATQAALPRAGIVHRLDKDTSGLMLVAASSAARLRLTAMIEERLVERQYLALCEGRMPNRVMIDDPLGRDPRLPIRRAVRPDGRPARTHVQPRALGAWASELEVRLDTGRTHQIRVHLAAQGHPLVGDRLYGARTAQRVLADLRGPEAALAVVAEFDRQALHAAHLSLPHPISGQPLSFSTAVPDDLERLLAAAATLDFRLSTDGAAR